MARLENYNALFVELTEKYSESNIKICHRSIVNVRNGKCSDIDIRNENIKICSVYVGEKSYKLYLNNESWVKCAKQDWTSKNNDGWVQLIVDTKEKCVSEIERIVNFIVYGKTVDALDLTKEAIAIEKEISQIDVVGKERETLIKVRVNQGVFRERLLERYRKCCLCGVSASEFLVASHIKPWCDCENEERLDINNGLLLCPNHDKLFDRGYISFDDDGQIIISTELSQTDSIFMNVNNDMHINMTEDNKKYMNYHRLNIFQNR